MFSTNKYRVKLNRELLQAALLNRDYKHLCDLFLSSFPDNETAKMVHFDLLTLNIKPVAFISYNRIAYNSIFEHDVRLTIDFNIEASKAIDFLRFKHNKRISKPLGEAVAILELKANGTIPSWLQAVIVNFGLRRIAFSKYKEGIEQLYAV